MAEQTNQQWAESRVRDASRKTAAVLRQVAEDIERLADEKDLDRIPGRVMHTFMWGIANAAPDGAATQYSEYVKAERAGHFDPKEDSRA